MILRRTALAIVLCAPLLTIAEPVAARFLSPDPAPADHENFNRYWYANNNPYTFVDPDGRWACASSTTNCSNFENALTTVDAASRSPALAPSEAAVLRGSVDQYGPKGDPSVQIRFKNDASIIQGTAAMNADGTRTLTFDEKRSPNELAIDVAHEGRHGADDMLRGRPVGTRQERLQTEVNAYSAQAYFQKAAGISKNANDGWTQAQGISVENISRQAEISVQNACLSETEGSCR